MKIFLLLTLSLTLGFSAYGQTKRKSARPRSKKITAARIEKPALPAACIPSKALKTASGLNYLITECGTGEKL